MNYNRILPFPDPEIFNFPELQALSKVWNEKKGQLENDGAYKEFVKKLQREWAIETGIIERLYTWDRGVTEVLIDQGVESSIISHRGGLAKKDAEDIQLLINDHLRIVEGLFGYIKGEEPLSEHFIRGLQAEFTAHQDYTEAVTESGTLIRITIQKGEYKSLPNNPRRPDGIVHAYCPPILTKEEMENLVCMYQAKETDSRYSPELKSAWLHHRFTQIHPFQDGNGRVARALASLVFLRAGLFPLVVRDSDRKEYIGALETADGGDLFPLVAFFAHRQRESILKALGLEQQVQQAKHADQIIAAALAMLKSKFTQEEKRVSAVFGYADRLRDLAEVKFKSLVEELNSQLPSLTPPQRKQKYLARTNFANNESPNRHYFHKQIVKIANEFKYFANFDKHRSWIRITITTDQDFDYVISFHGYGSADSGIMAASAFTYLRVPSEDGGTEAVNLHPASTDLFQFNYIEDFQSTEKRFKEWFESSLSIALAEWRRSLQV